MGLRAKYGAQDYVPVLRQLGIEIWSSDGVPTESGPATGALAVDTTNGNLYINQGTASVASWVLFSALGATIGASEISDAAITPAKLAGSESLTATADGTGTGAMTGSFSHAAVTSAAATNQISLPASSSALIGRTFTLWVGANGFELITPASSNATINGTDADGTNQADIPANSLSRVTLVAANTWILENIGSTGTVAAAIVPDND